MPAINTILSESETAPTPPLIDRALVEDYCKKNSISVHGLLDNLVKNGVNDFSGYLREAGSDLAIPANTKGILHESQNLFPQFEPRVSRGGPNPNDHEALVYATDDPNYAVFLGIISLKRDPNGDESKDGAAGISYSSDGTIRCSINKGFVNGPSEIKDGYMYILDQGFFHKDNPHHYTSPEPHTPMMVIPVKPKDLRAEIVVDMDR